MLHRIHQMTHPREPQLHPLLLQQPMLVWAEALENVMVVVGTLLERAPVGEVVVGVGVVGRA